jgi:hypothetical protein
MRFARFLFYLFDSIPAAFEMNRNRFKIKDKAAVCAFLAKHAKSNEYGSFLRQLNLHGILMDRAGFYGHPLLTRETVDSMRPVRGKRVSRYTDPFDDFAYFQRAPSSDLMRIAAELEIEA